MYHRPVHDYISYQLYVPGGKRLQALGDEPHVRVRIEAISVSKLSAMEQLNNCFFSYADAALIELYLESQRKNSFQGICVYPEKKDEKSLGQRFSSMKLQ